MILYDKNGKPYIIKNMKSSKVIGFDEKCFFRMRKSDVKHVEKIVKQNQELFFSESHFYRASVLKYAREFDNKGKRKVK